MASRMRHPAYAFGAYVLARALQMFFLSTHSSDVCHYFDTANAWLQGAVPYAQFDLEYPPGALVTFALPRLLTGDFPAYSQLFGVEMLLFDAAVLFLLCKMPAVISGERQSAPREVAATVWIYTLFTCILTDVQFERYDLVCGFLLMAWLYNVTTDGRRWVSDLLLALGVWVKLVPALLVPVYLAYLCSIDRTRPGRNTVAHWLWREGSRRCATMAVFGLALFWPFYHMAGNELLSFLHYHRLRGIQVESSFASLALLLHGQAAHGSTHAYGAWEIVHPWVRGLTQAATLGTLASFAFVSGLYVPRLWRAGTGPMRRVLLVEASLVLLLAFVGFSKVFSPQYFLWFAPFVALVPLRREARVQRWLIAFGAIALATVIYSHDYTNLIHLHARPVAIVLLRNVLLLGVGCAILAASRRRRPTP